MTTNLKDILTIDVPKWQTFEKMPLQELKEWERKLAPFYAKRSQINEEYGFMAWQKAMRCWYVFRCIKEIEEKSQN